MGGRSDRESTRLRARARREAEQHSDRRRENEERDGLVLAKTEGVGRIADAEEAEEEAADRVVKGPDPEDHAVWPAANEATQPQREGNRGEIPDHVVRDDEVDRPGLTERVRVREADADALGRRARRRVVLAVDDVADPPDREAERDTGSGRVGAVPDRHASTHRGDVPPEHAPDCRAPDRDAAGPDKEDLQRVRDVVLPLIDDVDEPRADDAADNSPRGNGPAILLTDLPSKQSERQPDAEEDADRGEDPVPSKRDRTEMNIRVERNLNHGERRHDAPRVARGSGLRASR